MREAILARYLIELPHPVEFAAKMVAGDALGRGVARMLEQALRTSGARRDIVCGRDTSTAVVHALELEVSEFVASAAPGAYLYPVSAHDRFAHDRQVVLKGRSARKRYVLF